MLYSRYVGELWGSTHATFYTVRLVAKLLYKYFSKGPLKYIFEHFRNHGIHLNECFFQLGIELQEIIIQMNNFSLIPSFINQ